MSELNNILIDVTCSLFLTIIVHNFMRIFFLEKRVNRFVEWASYFLFYLAPLLVKFLWGIPIINFTTNLIAIFLITCCYEASSKKRILVGILITVVNAVCDIITTVILFQNIEEYKTNHINYLFTVLLILLSVQVIKKIVKKGTTTSPDNCGWLMWIPICSLLIVYVVSNSAIQRGNIILISSSILVINFIVFYLYNRIIEMMLQQNEKELLEQKIAIYARELTILAEAQSQVDSFRHDIKHHIIELYSMADKENQKEEMKNYLMKMQNAMIVSKEPSHSGNQEIDGTINYFIQKAKEILKDVSVTIEIPEHIKEYQYELAIILGNLLENAIEAAMKTEEKMLTLQMKVKKGVLFIQISNSFDGIIKREGNLFLSGKNDGKKHGIGLDNVRRIIEQYNGDINITYEQKIFKIDLMFYLSK